jgi:hypothetical protein
MFIKQSLVLYHRKKLPVVYSKEKIENLHENNSALTYDCLHIVLMDDSVEPARYVPQSLSGCWV